MTNVVEVSKTNEILRRRKLRLQQVREQSKDIAKKVRQRANVEKLRLVKDLDVNTEKEYFQQQEKLLRRLELIYAQQLKNFGAGHSNAVNTVTDDTPQEDLSKLRGKTAAAKLRRKKQDILDEQKKILDRKLAAREAANVVSREKSAPSASKCGVPSTSKNDQNVLSEQDIVRPTTADMATQWSVEAIPEESSALNLDNLDQNANKNDNDVEKNKRLNLFALSEEMPSSLRGGISSNSDEINKIKPSLTLVSEYLLNRQLKLRESDDTNKKKDVEDLHKIKQTILRTRSTRKEGKPSKFNKSSSKTHDSSLSKKSSITMYSHSTKDVRDIPNENIRLVAREKPSEEDAYSQAMKQNSITSKEQEHHQKLQEIRSKVAMTRQNVDKEYQETMTFLNSLPNDSSKIVKSSFMSDQRQQSAIENRQRKMQHEYQSLERDHRRQSCRTGMHQSQTNTSLQSCQSQSKSQDDFLARDLQYSWMPVPESDNNLAVHTIPTSVKESRQGNSVKFSKVDSYHEYRSRHKHTPPTKDTSNSRKPTQDPENFYSNSDTSSDSSSIENLHIQTTSSKSSKNDETVGTEKIIVYKILDSKNEKRNKKKCSRSKSREVDIEKSLNKIVNYIDRSKGERSCLKSDRASIENLHQGSYTAVSENGDNMNSDNLEKDKNNSNTIAKKSDKHTCSCSHSQKRASDATPINHIDLSTSKSNKEDGPRDNKCKCNTSKELNYESVLQKQVPATISNSSFRTASTEKGVEIIPESFVNLVKNNSLDTDKLYIGASGLFKNDAYEVVIQLRKKDNKNGAKNSTEEKVSNQEGNKSLNSNVCLPPHTQSVRESDNVSIKDKDSAHSDLLDTNVVINEKNDCNIHNKSDNVTQSNENLIEKQAPNLCDKSASTSLQLSYAIPKEIPIDNYQPRPATSACTQTTFNSPNRPMFVHMSSSTSTAYMSPPEMVLPKFFERDYKTTTDVYDSDYRKDKRRTYYKKDDSCNENKICRCKKVHSKTNIKNSKKRRENQISSSTISPEPVKMRHQKGNGEHRHNKNTCSKHKQMKLSQNSRATYFSGTDYEKEINNIICKDSNRKKALDPVLKHYVNKLLMLNKESLKAIDVVNQECSSIATPNSSVVNLPSNSGKSKLDNKISLEQIKNILKQKILDDDSKERDSRQKSKQAAKIDLNYMHKPKLSKKRSIHKVKSFNVSKRLVRSKGHVKDVSQVSPKSSLITSSTTNKSCESNLSNKNKKQPKRHSCFQKIPSEQKVTRVHKNFHKATDISPAINATSSKSSSPLRRYDKKAFSDAKPDYKLVEDINLMKQAEDKLQNMEKIADLTEKCTKRLSNLAKVLDEVRRNKTSYNQKSETSDSSETGKKVSKNDIIYEKPHEGLKISSDTNTTEYNLQKQTTDDSEDKSLERCLIEEEHINNNDFLKLTVEKPKSKPPPALSRIHLKHHQEHMTPHELSTVVEVDSPMSLKMKNHVLNDDMLSVPDSALEHSKVNPDLLQCNIRKNQSTNPYNLSSDGTKLQMMDLSKFNEIMLKPFMSLQDYARNEIGLGDNCLNIDDIVKEGVNDEISSLHSEGSLPDVIAELLKRNLISEPFRFESPSNVNSTTVSSDSTSLLALSKVVKDKRKSSAFLKRNKENNFETSDTMSASSNPDLENVFKKLGMGWASSTLKKTKERLALSSSSNSSSSSLPQFKVANFDRLDTNTSLLNSSKTSKQSGLEISKNMAQQTSLSNSTTVKEFLKNELAKKITFTNTSKRNETEEEFVSLYETKMPDELKNNFKSGGRDEESINTTPKDVRARTSTPVQLFKSITYRSTSSSNTSNGLFSNADDLSSVKITSNSVRNHSTSDKDDLTIPNYSLKIKRNTSDLSKSD